MQEVGANFARWHCREKEEIGRRVRVIGENGTDEDLRKAKGCDEWESAKVVDWVKI